MSTTYTANANLIFSNAEGIESQDFDEMEVRNIKSISDWLAQPGMNISPDTHAYAHNDNSFIWSEGIQPLARPGTGASTVTNNAGTIYFITGNDPDPTTSTFAVYMCHLSANAFGLGASDFTADATHPRYATVGLTVAAANDSVTRDFIDDATDIVTVQTTPKHQQFTITPHVTLGTPGVTPSVPATTGAPWAVVLIPANNVSPFAAVNVQPMAFPRGVQTHIVSAFEGQPAAGNAVNPPSATYSGTTWINGIEGTVAAGAVNLQDSTNVGGITDANATGTHIFWSFDAVPTTATITEIDCHWAKPFANTSTMHVKDNSYNGSTVYDTLSVTGVFPKLATAMFGFTAPQNTVLEYITSNGNGTQLFGFLVKWNAPSPGSLYGFAADTANNHITSTGTPATIFQYLLPVPISSASQRLAKVNVNASVVSGRFELVQVSGSTITPVASISTMNSVLSGSTYNVSALTTPVWCNHGNKSPFDGSNNGQLFLSWEPSAAGETLSSVEFVITG